VRRLNATPPAQALVREQLQSLPFQPAGIGTAPGMVSRPEKRGLLSAVENAPAPTRLVIGPNMIDANMVKGAAARMRQQARLREPPDDKLWDLLLARGEVNDRIFRVRDVAELEYLVNAIHTALGEFSGGSEVALVVDTSEDDARIAQDLRTHPQFSDIPVIKRPIGAPEQGFLPVAVSLVSNKGRRRITTLLLLATVWNVWRSVRSAASRNELAESLTTAG
jgi:hypothetical protein